MKRQKTWGEPPPIYSDLPSEFLEVVQRGGNVIKTRIAAFVGCIVLSLLIIGCSKVATGDVVTCRTCGRQILNTVQYVTVPFWKTSEYRVSNALSYCEVCGNQQLPYKIHVQCRHCRFSHF